MVRVDPAHITYAGHSLGAFLGGITVSVATDVRASLLNVGGAGWADFLENTDTLLIRCSVVDGLITAGILMGDKWNPMDPQNPTDDTGLCTACESERFFSHRRDGTTGRQLAIGMRR